MKTYVKGFSSAGGGICKVPEPEKAFCVGGLRFLSSSPLSLPVSFSPQLDSTEGFKAGEGRD